MYGKYIFLMYYCLLTSIIGLLSLVIKYIFSLYFEFPVFIKSLPLDDPDNLLNCIVSVLLFRFRTLYHLLAKSFPY